MKIPGDAFAKYATVPPMRSRICGFVLGFALLVSGRSLFANPSKDARYAVVSIEPVKTSIYIGNVLLRTTPMKRDGDVYTADYNARVFPYFFSSEKGRLWITITNDDLANLEKGQAVFFKGHAENNDHEQRRIEGRALPADLSHGKIKVRVFVTEKIQLIFNTTYHFGETGSN